MRRALPSLALATAGIVAACAAPGRTRAPSPTADVRRDSAAIHDAIVRGARAFERGDPDGVLAHYARDIVLSYPGIPDMDHAALVKGYGELRSRPATEKTTTVPTFDEILVSGDLAIVRMRWSTTVVTPERTARRTLKDLQVWRREPDGRWMFVRGMHYREPERAARPS